MCPYYLDGDLGQSLAALPGDTRVIGYCAVFKVRGEAPTRRTAGAVSQNSTACDHRQLAKREPRGLPDPVDVLVTDRALAAGALQ